MTNRGLTTHGSKLGLVLFALAASLFVSCSDDNGMVPAEFVTISGIVRNVDFGGPAAGVRVSLYGTDYRDARPTGTDGAYSLSVPKGSKLILLTDDFDPNQNEWFPLINAESSVTPIATADDNDWSLHSCPNTAVPEQGSVAAWDNFLQNWDDTNGDQFVPRSAAESGGIVVVRFIRCNGGAFGGTAGMTVSTDSPAFPMRYLDRDHFFTPFPNRVPDWSLGPDIFPDSWQATDPSGFVLGFGEASLGRTTVQLTIADSITTRGLGFQSPWEVPVRPGTITMCFLGSIDGATNKGFREVAKCGGLLP